MKLLLTITTTFLMFFSFSAVKTTVTNGSWFDPNVWSPSGVPMMEDTVIINHNITVQGNYVDFGANWLIVNPAASVVGDTIFALHGNLKMHGLMDLNIIAVGDGDSTQVYGTIHGRKYIPGNPNNFNYTGNILSDSLILGDNFQNYADINVMTLVVGGPSMINRNGAMLKVNGSAIFGGVAENESNGLIDIYSLLTSENFTNNGMVYCYDWTHAQATVSGVTGRFCIENCFMNVSTISGTIDICDNSPGGFCDMNLGTIAGSVTTCSSGPCPVIGVSELNEIDFEITPNPATSGIQLFVPLSGIAFLYNTLGKEIGQYLINDGSCISVDHLSEGIYYISFGGSTKRFIVSR